MKTRAIRCMDVLAGVQIVSGIALLIYVFFFATITLDSVRLGPLAVAGGGAALVAILALLLQLPLMVFVLLKRPGARLRVFGSMVVGVIVFIGLFESADTWVVHKLPYLHSPLPGESAQAR